MKNAESDKIYSGYNAKQTQPSRKKFSAKLAVKLYDDGYTLREISEYIGASVSDVARAVLSVLEAQA